MTVGLIFLLVVTPVLIAIPVVNNTYPFTPGGATNAILTITGERTSNGVHLLSPAGGVIVLLLWAFVPAILGASITMNRDIT